jgi:hypothetical protein
MYFSRDNFYSIFNPDVNKLMTNMQPIILCIHYNNYKKIISLIRQFNIRLFIHIFNQTILYNRYVAEIVHIIFIIDFHVNK